MNTALIAGLWDDMAGRRLEIIKRFYGVFFERYPQYTKHFPPMMDHQMEKMVESISMMARMADDPNIIGPHLVKLGKAHERYGLNEADMNNFRDVFLEVMAEFAGDRWDDRTAHAWRSAFDDVLIPKLMEGVWQA